MNRTLGVGLIGCGNISDAYLRLVPQFKGIKLQACADLNAAAATEKAQLYGVRAETVDGLLASDDIDVVVNLTVPAAHFEVSKRILEAGKHVYSEKPFVLALREGLALKQLADERGLRIGSAPDTFLGGAHQQCRMLVDDGFLGPISSGSCHVMSRGMEHWHPNPDFFFKTGGGPVLDLGPYYLTNLVQLLGPVKTVAALSSIPSPVREISSEPRKGQMIEVETPTTLHAVLGFASGAVITFGASWDVQDHRHSFMELYGSKGTLFGPDPNYFDGTVDIALGDDKRLALPHWDHPLEKPNMGLEGNAPFANYRGVGLADMGAAILQDRSHRCNHALALHVCEVMFSIIHSGEEHRFIELKTSCERPAPLEPEDARALLRDKALTS